MKTVIVRLLLATILSIAGAAAAPPVVVLTDTTSFIAVDPVARYYIDTQSLPSASPAVPAAILARNWENSPTLPLNAGYLRNSIWVRFTIHDQSTGKRHFYLSLSNAQIDTVELYWPDSSGLRLIARSGKLTERVWPAVTSRFPLFALTKASDTGINVCFLRIRTSDVCAISLKVTDAEYRAHANERANLLYGVYFGAIGVIAFFNIFLFFAVRFGSCLWYAFWVISFGLFQVSTSGHWNLFSGIPVWFANSAVPISVGSCLFFGAVISTLFLDLRKISPLFWKIFAGFGTIGILIIATSWIDSGRPASVAASIFSGLSVLTFLAAGIYAMLRGVGRTAVFYTCGISVFTIGILLNVFRNFGILPDVFITAQGNLVASVIEIAIFAIALIDRIMQIEKDKSHEKEKVQISERLAAESRLQALQSQINPHFLFNTLNTIAEMTAADSARAEKMVTDLSRLYRFTLSASERKFIPLSEELDMVKTYLAIEKERYGRRLEYTVTIKGDPSQVYIPGLLIQPIVENAVKHGIGPMPEDGKVEITCTIDEKTGFIRIRDNGCGFGKAPKSSGAGHGFRNVRERLSLAYGASASLTFFNDKGAVVEVSFPRKDFP